jgi:RNA polymerase sigma-70 factor (ECF subfamily)
MSADVLTEEWRSLVIVATGQDLSERIRLEREDPQTQPTSPESAFQRLFVENYGRVVSVLHRLLADRAQAEELANDVFWRLYRQPWLRGNTDGRVGGWLFRTATNLGIDALRAAARRKHYEHAAGQVRLEAAAADPLHDVLQAEKRRRVRSTLARLKPAQARILILRSSGFSYSELAECLGVKRSSMGTLLARAEAQFQKRYLQLYGKNEEGL